MNGQEFESTVFVLNVAQQRLREGVADVWGTFMDFRNLNGLRSTITASRLRLESLEKAIITSRNSDDRERLRGERNAIELGLKKREAQAELISARVTARITKRNAKKGR